MDKHYRNYRDGGDGERVRIGDIVCLDPERFGGMPSFATCIVVSEPNADGYIKLQRPHMSVDKVLPGPNAVNIGIEHFEAHVSKLVVFVTGPRGEAENHCY